MTEAGVDAMVFVAAIAFAFVMLLAVSLILTILDAVFFNGFFYKWVMKKLEGDEDDG